LAWLVGIILALIVATVIAFTVSVKPGVFIIKKMFDQPVEVIDKTRYAEDEPKVERMKDITYDSQYDNGSLDIVDLSEGEGPQPNLLWVHGGGYVGGDK